MPFSPTTIKRLGKESLEITWRDGHRGIYPNRYLRDNCPCAGCREGKPRRLLPIVGSPGEIYPVQIGIVGNEALGKHPHQHRHGEKRAGYFDQRKPFSVVTCGGHDS